MPLTIPRSILTLTCVPRPNPSGPPRKALRGGQQPNTGSDRRSLSSYLQRCTRANTAARGPHGSGSSHSPNRRARGQHSSRRDGPGGPTQKPEEDVSRTYRCRAATRSYPAPSSSHLEVHVLPHNCSARNTIICDVRASRSLHGRRRQRLVLSVESNGRCVSLERSQKAAQQSHSPRQERKGSP